MAQALLSNLAVILLVFICISFVTFRLKKISSFILFLINTLVYSSLVISLFYIPIKIGDFLFDLRVVILLFLAVTQGWRLTVPVLIITSIWRFNIGGDVALEAILYNMIVPVIIGLTFYRNGTIENQYKKLFLLGTSVWFVTLMPITWVVPNGWDIFKSIAIIHYLTFIFGFIVLFGLYLVLIKYKEMEERIHHMAYHDNLTGLPNRYFLKKYLEKLLSSVDINNQKVTIMFIDLDRFKIVNDTMGHSYGDLLLKKVTERMKQSIPNEATIFRYGGDEFIIILECNTNKEVIEVAQQIIEAFSSPFLLNNQELFTTPSIGISMYPKDGNKAEILIDNADIAMYDAKVRGKNNYQFYSSESRELQLSSAFLEMDIKKAIEQKEFMIYYQPQINIKTGKIIGVEALIRWNHAELGVIPPSEFIPLAEETGLIVPLGKWVLEMVCAQNKEWKNKGYSPLPISINISARQFQHVGFVDTIDETLDIIGLDARYLELEITESIAINRDERLLTKLQSLREKGIKISLDDFGTGYSSLTYLKEYPIDKLKIDKTIIQNILRDSKDEAIIHAIVALSNNLGITVIAEGVETEEQLELVVQLGCQCIQGYFCSKPLNATMMEEMFQGQNEKVNLSLLK